MEEHFYLLFPFFLFDFSLWTRFGNSSRAFDVLGFNLVALAAAILFKDRGLFFVFWKVLSLKRAYKEQRVGIFIRNAAAITGAFLLFSPISFAPLNQSMAFWISMSNAFGIAHISLTFATSRYNPEFIIRLFGGSRLIRDRRAA